MMYQNPLRDSIPYGSTWRFSPLYSKLRVRRCITASVIALMLDLRAMGETNALVQRRRHFSSRTLFVRAGELYAERYGREGRIPATFDVTYLAGWAPHASQQKPLRPGSAKTRLATALDADEQSAGEKAGPMGSKKIP